MGGKNLVPTVIWRAERGFENMVYKLVDSSLVIGLTRICCEVSAKLENNTKIMMNDDYRHI